MENAKVIGFSDGHWIIRNKEGTDYFLRDHQIKARRPAVTGQEGHLGYVQGASSKILTFIADDDGACDADRTANPPD